jgi:hypothetical protein
MLQVLGLGDLMFGSEAPAWRLRLWNTTSGHPPRHRLRVSQLHTIIASSYAYQWLS